MQTQCGDGFNSIQPSCSRKSGERLPKGSRASHKIRIDEAIVILRKEVRDTSYTVMICNIAGLVYTTHNYSVIEHASTPVTPTVNIFILSTNMYATRLLITPIVLPLSSPIICSFDGDPLIYTAVHELHSTVADIWFLPDSSTH